MESSSDEENQSSGKWSKMDDGYVNQSSFEDNKIREDESGEVIDNDDPYEAPVLWISKTFDVDKSHIKPHHPVPG